ncbi:S-layer homology domain-containing protein [Vallitalea okinawensis]|uniref:S-layer homology domain-containing protein n=1 Tax=Vallitalea okinawensis TaxID=2078660 RepID=UPI0014790BF4|nr:S-layer homology domain-containing protein [Vallitalea okinawensis]
MIRRTLVLMTTIVLSLYCIAFTSSAKEENRMLGMPIGFTFSEGVDWNLDIEGITAVKINDDIEFSIYYENSEISFYSFFNPPEGDKIKIMGNPSELENENGLLKIRYSLEEFKKFGSITISIIDGYSNHGYIFLESPKKINYDQLEEIFEFENEILNQLVKEKLNKDKISKDDLEAIETLTANDKGIYYLNGLEYLPQLKYLDLRNNNISDLSLLSELDQLEVLYLEGNPVQDYTPIYSLFDNLIVNDFPNEEVNYLINEGKLQDLNVVKEHSNLLIAYTASKFSDLSESEWYTKNISYLYVMKVISGYSDGTFKPDSEISIDEFVKMIITILGYDMEPGKEYWASPFIEKAHELGLIQESEFTNYRRQITRGEMARIVARAVSSDSIKDETLEVYKDSIMDYDSIPDEYKESILIAFSEGIISGYTDNTFRYDQLATRAEAASIIIRLIDIDARAKPEQ